jgi:hypothetical protein
MGAPTYDSMTSTIQPTHLPFPTSNLLDDKDELGIPIKSLRSAIISGNVVINTKSSHSRFLLESGSRGTRRAIMESIALLSPCEIGRFRFSHRLVGRAILLEFQ